MQLPPYPKSSILYILFLYFSYQSVLFRENFYSAMKIRTIKLREVHKSDNGESSFCSLLWDHSGQHIVTASSSDNSICIHDALLPSNAPKILRNHREGVTALAISPNSTCLASGSVDHSVKLYKFPGNFYVGIFVFNFLTNCFIDFLVVLFFWIFRRCSFWGLNLSSICFHLSSKSQKRGK